MNICELHVHYVQVTGLFKNKAYFGTFKAEETQLNILSNGDNIETKQGLLETKSISDNSDIETNQVGSTYKATSDVEIEETEIKGGTSWRKILLSLVGLSGVSTAREMYHNEQTLSDYKKRMVTVEEHGKVRYVLNVLAGVVLGMMVVLYSYFF